MFSHANIHSLRAHMRREYHIELKPTPSQFTFKYCELDTAPGGWAGLYWGDITFNPDGSVDYSANKTIEGEEVGEDAHYPTIGAFIRAEEENRG